jgi:hypothetical protein
VKAGALEPAAALAPGFLRPGGAAWGLEGRWTPEQVVEDDPVWLPSLGFEIPPQRLWRREGWKTARARWPNPKPRP